MARYALLVTPPGKNDDPRLSLNILSPLHVVSCMVRLDCFAKNLEHFLHWWGFFCRWMFLTCSSKCPFLGYVLPQMSHSKGFSPVWVLTWNSLVTITKIVCWLFSQLWVYLSAVISRGFFGRFLGEWRVIDLLEIWGFGRFYLEFLNNFACDKIVIFG